MRRVATRRTEASGDNTQWLAAYGPRRRGNLQLRCKEAGRAAGPKRLLAAEAKPFPGSRNYVASKQAEHMLAPDCGPTVSGRSSLLVDPAYASRWSDR